MFEYFSLGQKIREIRTQKNISRKRFAQRLDVVESRVSQIESDRIKSPGIEQVKKYAEALEVSVSELIGEPVQHKRLVPLLDWICAGNGQPTHESPHPGHSEEYVETDLTAPRIFALRIQGDSMLPLFREGETILVNPDLEVMPGDFCVAKIENEEAATLKRLVRVGTVYFLQPLNPAYDNIPVTKKVRIVGRVVRSQKDW